jgi:hypothetical protein
LKRYRQSFNKTAANIGNVGCNQAFVNFSQNIMLFLVGWLIEKAVKLIRRGVLWVEWIAFECLIMGDN